MLLQRHDDIGENVLLGGREFKIWWRCGLGDAYGGCRWEETMQDFWQTGFDNTRKLALKSFKLASNGINFDLESIKLDLKNIFSDGVGGLATWNIRIIGERKRVNLLGEFLRTRPILNFLTLTRRLR
jgi:hypothetical protein